MIKVFEGNGQDFSATREAEAWLKSEGYSVGSMQRGDPRGIMKGDYIIAKWRNLSAKNRKELDGLMTNNGRGAPVMVEIFDK